ncbi:MAG: adenylate/guanylate cyclase domain-containing protein [Deltaproteobacteria bacterium]|nr:adenylate/guanylate cyclase domain-containing protein [Deltaproteobacteria bacterium]
MPEQLEKKSKKSISSHIRSSRKEITILFTDIEGSTQYWDKSGDIEGRLMVDRHNRLLFPVIKKFRGTIIKTIGDAIMASFKKPKKAVEAAIAMQQILEKERQSDDTFTLKIRIGIHTGSAIVEKNDVYGNVVNVAARIESQAGGSEILLSHSAYEMLKEKAGKFKRLKSFEAKGKRGKIRIYSCDWQSHSSLIADIKIKNLLPVAKRQKFELLLYLLLTISASYMVYIKYIRYFLMDHEPIAYAALNPAGLYEHPFLLILITCFFTIAISSILFLLLRRKRLPLPLLHFLKGCYGASALFILFYMLFSLLPLHKMLPLNINSHLNKVIHQSQYLLVEVIEQKTHIKNTPSLEGENIKEVKKGTLLLLVDIARKGNITWNKVPVKSKEYGWLPRIIPPEIGVPAKRISLTKKFYFRHIDLYTLIFPLLGFIWGIISFKIRPI